MIRHDDSMYNLWKNGVVIASCRTIEAHNAARRLLGQQP